jgi:hypothetical protein
MSTGSITASSRQIPWNEQEQIARRMAVDLATSLDTTSIEKLRKGGLTSNQLNTVKIRLEQIAEQGEGLFGKEVDLRDIRVQEFVKTKLSDVISTVAETAGNQPDLIREASVSEAVFSHKGSDRPILATDSLATCIGVAGYDPVNQFGFVVHFTWEDEVKASGDMLLNRIRAYREQKINAPLLVNLRGGIKGMSEPLLSKVKEWLTSNDLNCIIASEDTLQPSIISVPGSLKLDVRTGTCETYDSSSNPLSKNEKIDIKELNEDSMDKLIVKLFIEVASKKPEIKIVYDSKAS